MLPATARLTTSQEFRLVVRRGRRAGRSRLVVHVLRPDTATRTEFGVASARHSAGSSDNRAASVADVNTAPTREMSEHSRVGFVVSKAVGTAVIRHRVARRLRHLMAQRLVVLPAGTLVVVRALPPAATAPSRELGADLDAAFRKLRMLAPEDRDPSTGPT